MVFHNCPELAEHAVRLLLGLLAARLYRHAASPAAVSLLTVA